MNLFLRPELSYNSYSYIDPMLSNFLINNEKKWESSLMVNLNFQFNLGIKSKKSSYLFVALQSGWKEKNNYDDLDEQTINTVLFQGAGKSIESSETGKIGKYEKENILPINFDIGFTPRLFDQNYFGFNAFLRTEAYKKVNNTRMGFGLYVANEKNPSKITGGLGWQFNDVFLKTNTTKGFVERSSIFLYAGFALSKK